jgi:hypothetical protein
MATSVHLKPTPPEGRSWLPRGANLFADGHAVCCIGSSLHGRIAAISMRVPTVTFANPKIKAEVETWETEPLPYEVGWDHWRMRGNQPCALPRRHATTWAIMRQHGLLMPGAWTCPRIVPVAARLKPDFSRQASPAGIRSARLRHPTAWHRWSDTSTSPIPTSLAAFSVFEGGPHEQRRHSP